jgi:hypothetical protein
VSGLNEYYFEWLYDQAFIGRRTRMYTALCRQMQRTEFKIVVPMDENRAAEGTILRNDFAKAENIFRTPDFVDLLLPNASILEVLIGIAKQADFMVDRGVQWWFVEFIRNLGLQHCSDEKIRPFHERQISRALTRFNERTYNDHGQGGIFPLHIPNSDQREVEIWYQMCAYMTEHAMY